MASKKENPADLSVEQKLKNLYQLQTKLSEIDKIKTLRGELPLEVQDLEDEIEGLTHRLKKYEEEIDAIKADITHKHEDIATAQEMVSRYEKQLDNVSNNREYDNLTKEIEFQGLEIELLKKKIREAERLIELKQGDLDRGNETLRVRQQDLELKRTELDEIVSETKAEEEKLREKAKRSKPTSNRVCSPPSSAFARVRATVSALSTCNVTPAVVASTKFRLSDSSTSACARRSSSANTAVAS